jgi:hypothetical protein|tara:strand:+ start:474 stop:875 length:402 start_codon:yes stop_codon:yes gene_type:complete
MKTVTKLLATAILISTPLSSNAWSTFSEYYDVPPRIQFDYAAQQAALDAALAENPDAFWIFFSDTNNWAPTDFCTISYYTHHELGAWETCNTPPDYTPNFPLDPTNPVPVPPAILLFGSALIGLLSIFKLKKV